MIPDSHITYIGVDDDNLDLFEGQYPVPNGISYNSYLIVDSHTAIIDAVDARRCQDWLDNIRRALPQGCVPEYVVVQHAEPDHTGSLEALLHMFPDIKIVCTAKCANILAMYFEDADIAARAVTVKEGETLSLGRATLQFIMAPMVHWPEVMMTLDVTDRVLFSADAFGSFAMWGDTGEWDSEARRYYCNIVGRFGVNVQQVMKKLKDLDFGIIAPLHGPMLSEGLPHYWRLYDKWSTYTPESDGVLVAYASVYGGTAQAARRITAMLNEEGLSDVVPMDLCRHHVSYAVAQAFRLRGLLLACATYDAALFPAMHTFLHHLVSKRLQGRVAGIIENGSWAPVAGRLINEQLMHMQHTTLVQPVITLSGRPRRNDDDVLRKLAHNMAEALRAH